MEEVVLADASKNDSKGNGTVHREYQSISRKIPIAPMMDWTDQVNITFGNKRLWGSKSLVAFW
jgi:hypothetical protein